MAPHTERKPLRSTPRGRAEQRGLPVRLFGYGSSERWLRKGRVHLDARDSAAVLRQTECALRLAAEIRARAEAAARNAAQLQWEQARSIQRSQQAISRGSA